MDFFFNIIRIKILTFKKRSKKSSFFKLESFYFVMKKIIFMIGFILLFFSGCSSSNVVFVPGMDDIYDLLDSVLGPYLDLSFASHSEKALFDGRSYMISGHVSLDIGESLYFLGCTQNKATHFEKFAISFGSSPIDIHLYEDVNVSSYGNQIYGVNLDRNKYLNLSDMNTYSNATFTNLSTTDVIFHSAAYGGNNIEGSIVFPQELILRTNTCYVFEIKNNDGNANDFTYLLVWHESINNYDYYFS